MSERLPMFRKLGHRSVVLAAVSATCLLMFSGCGGKAASQADATSASAETNTDRKLGSSSAAGKSGNQAAGNQAAGKQAADQTAKDKWADHTQGLPFVVGYESGLQASKAADKPALMFVTTTWCWACKKLAEESFNDDRVRNLLVERFVLVIVDGDKEAAAIEKLGGIEGFPTIVFLSPAGKELGKCAGYRPVNEFEPILRRALGM